MGTFAYTIFLERFILSLDFILLLNVFSLMTESEYFTFRSVTYLKFNMYNNYGTKLCFFKLIRLSDFRGRNEECENSVMFMFWSTSQTLFQMHELLKAQCRFCQLYFLFIFVSLSISKGTGSVCLHFIYA